jgi:hypothetical protein
MKRCGKSTGSNEVNCFADATKTILASEIKAGGDRLDVSELVAASSVFQDSKSSGKSQLKWSSKDIFVVELAIDGAHTFDLYVFKREQAEKELVLLKKLESVMAHEVVRRQSNGQFYLIYSKYLNNNVTFDVSLTLKMTN